jgi:hypothetical protein
MGPPPRGDCKQRPAGDREEPHHDGEPDPEIEAESRERVEREPFESAAVRLAVEAGLAHLARRPLLRRVPEQRGVVVRHRPRQPRDLDLLDHGGDRDGA